MLFRSPGSWNCRGIPSCFRACARSGWLEYFPKNSVCWSGAGTCVHWKLYTSAGSRGTGSHPGSPTNKPRNSVTKSAGQPGRRPMPDHRIGCAVCTARMAPRQAHSAFVCIGRTCARSAIQKSSARRPGSGWPIWRVVRARQAAGWKAPCNYFLKCCHQFYGAESYGTGGPLDRPQKH